MESHIIDGHSKGHCVEFDYYLPQNSTDNKITVALKTHDGNKTNLFTIVADKDKQGWQHYRNSLQDTGKNFKVRMKNQNSYCKLVF